MHSELPPSCGVLLVDMGTYGWRDDQVEAQAVQPKTQPGGCTQTGSLPGGSRHVHFGPSKDGPAAAGPPHAVAESASFAVAATATALHLVQALPRSLSSRLMLLPWPLPACIGEDPLLEQTAPGFLDAPGAWVSCPSHMRELWEARGMSPPAKPKVTMVFAAAVGLKDIAAINTPVGSG